jgi:hypothetical protein
MQKTGYFVTHDNRILFRAHGQREIKKAMLEGAHRLSRKVYFRLVKQAKAARNVQR